MTTIADYNAAYDDDAFPVDDSPIELEGWVKDLDDLFTEALKPVCDDLDECIDLAEEMLDDNWECDTEDYGGYCYTRMVLPELHEAHVTCYETEILSTPY